MAALVLVVLAVAWIVVFVPAAKKARDSSPRSTVERFKKRMRLLAPQRSHSMVLPRPNEDMGRRSIARARRRRKRIFVALLCLCAGTVAVPIVMKGQGLELHLVADALLAAYVAHLRETKRRREEAAATITPLGDQQVADTLEDEDGLLYGVERA